MTRKTAAFPLNQFMNLPPHSNDFYQINIAVFFADNNVLRKYNINVIAAFGNKQLPALRKKREALIAPLTKRPSPDSEDRGGTVAKLLNAVLGDILASQFPWRT
jgi:hypothetical protein